MAPLAALCQLSGRRVSGTDNESNSKTTHLQSLGVIVNCGHSAGAMPDDTELLIYSSAVPVDNPERQKALKLGIPQLCRGAALAEFSRDYRRVVAVSGAHGKSSITSLMAHILRETGFLPGYMIGAELNGSCNYARGNGDIFVTEADESDGTHKLLQPWCGIIPNYDPDHAWSVGGEEQLKANFREFASKSENLIYYGFDDVKEFCHARETMLDVVPDDFQFAGFFGYEAANAFIAVKGCELLGCPYEKAVAAAETYPGIARRMTVRVKTPDFTVIEDYAHHPVEVRSSINLLRHKYADCHLRVVFQPHRYARLEKFFDGFVEELKKADSLFVAPVFAAWSETGSVNSAQLAKMCKGKAISSDWENESAAILEPPNDGKKLLVAVLGAGDINSIFSYLERETVL
jgi:UDP-N-acetylmuramate--alanine ligase